MVRDREAFRERFKAYKNGKAVSEIYDAGLPKYGDGSIPEVVDDATLDFIIGNEGFTNKLIKDPGNGALSIGSGINVQKYINQFRNTGRWTQEDNRRAVREIVAGNRAHIRSKISNYDKLTDNQKRALDDIVYNIGSLNKSPKFVAAVLAGDSNRAKFEMNWGNKQRDIYGRPLRGLRTRNAARLALWDDTTITPLQLQLITTVPDAVKVVKTIPQELTTPTYDTNISPYISGKPMVHLLPKVNLPNLLLMLDDDWEPIFNYACGKLPEYSNGKISIKPANRGKLTRLKARTGKSESELYNDGNPAHKKMVVFARNARKWKH